MRLLLVLVLTAATVACSSPTTPSNDQTPCAAGYKRVDNPPAASVCVPR